ncbi:PLD nuclease N-terminal domain-containing protein [Proteinivorax tanatarense]|uniref:PLD nuclease N-terminal domain-containing protein n=1 Tax=Proteinivorax tanatarense TaxID=1260629 RepID=A0AAU7VM32_9FIRM
MELFLFSFLIIGTIGIIGTVFWIWALIDVAKTPTEDFKNPNDKLLWILIVVLAHFVGAIIYFFVGRKQKKF